MPSWSSNSARQLIQADPGSHQGHEEVIDQVCRFGRDSWLVLLGPGPGSTRPFPLPAS